MTDPIIQSLSGAILPETATLRRAHVRSPSRQTEHYLERYDNRTLFYDCVYQDRQKAYLFTAPRFLNLWPEFRDRLRLDGAPVRGLSRRWSAKYEQVVVRAPRGDVTLDWPGGGWAIAPRDDISDRFAGLNAVVTMNKDNDPAWIRAWLSYLVEVHGLDAALIYDNGSTAYTLADLAQALSSIPGLKQLCIQGADYPYGPRDSGKGMEVRPKFLQPALLNLARTDILRRARAVLNVDIDEIVLRRGDTTIFDQTVATWAGAVRIPGQWAYPAPDTPGSVGHGAHIWRATRKKKASNPKWCAVPRGPLSRMGWFVHHVGGEAFRLLRAHPTFEFAHCRATSTGWKGAGRFAFPTPMVRDPELESLMAQYFSDDTPGA